MSQLPDTFDEKYFQTKYGKKDSSDNYEVLNPKKTKCISKFVLERVKIPRNKYKNLLEIGYGYGILLNSFKGHFNSLFGTDISEHAIKYAKTHIQGYIKVHDIQENPPFDKKFDVILAIDVLEHLNKLDEGIENIKSMMYDNSILIVEIPLFTGSWYNKILWKLIFDKDPTHVVRIDFKKFESIMNKHGFTSTYRGTVLELLGITRISKSALAEKFTGQHLGEWILNK
ncbi:MAG: class I SAM-dependent methyltransferase [Candidatus Heimdallarchaeota archaeon]